VKRFVMTGAPGCGKTSILRVLGNLGYAVVEEAATDVIAAQQARGSSEPWNDPLFIDAIVRLQEQRRQEQVRPGRRCRFMTGHRYVPSCSPAIWATR
jgi:predicted ATPase